MMPFQWILYPVTLWAAAGAALALSLYLVLTVKISRRASAKAVTPAAPGNLEELSRRLDELEERQRETEQRAETASPVAVRPSINLSRRSQALRLYRRGEAPEEIARTLEAPVGEVRLLLKVHRIQMAHALGPAALKSEGDSADKLNGQVNEPQ
jgi:hypothetical protein